MRMGTDGFQMKEEDAERSNYLEIETDRFELHTYKSIKEPWSGRY